MKKFSLLLLVLICFLVVGCGNKQLEITELYGKYQYGECVYINNASYVTEEQQNKLYQGISRYSFKEKVYTYYETKSTEETFSIENIEYKQVNVNESLSKEDQLLLKKVTTRYDLYRSGKFQGYSLLYGKDKYYFMETRNSSTEDNIIIWQIVELKKLD